jgi:hypothetical protein
MASKTFCRVPSSYGPMGTPGCQLGYLTGAIGRSLRHSTRTSGSEQSGQVTTAQGDSQMIRTHEPGQDLFRSVLPDDVDWKSFAAFPAPVRLAAIVGQPSEPARYVVRAKVPAGVKLMPHRHSDRTSAAQLDDSGPSRA